MIIHIVIAGPGWLGEIMRRIHFRCFKHDWREWRPSLDGVWDTRRCLQCGKPQRVRKESDPKYTRV